MKSLGSIIVFIIVLFSVTIISCTKEDDSIIDDHVSRTITVGAFSLKNGVYTALGNELIFDSEKECQTWSRTAKADVHDSIPHLHYNAAANVSYNHNSITFSWTEYGPELNQASIETICYKGISGVEKTVNSNSYYQDKPNVYLKITNVIEN